MRIRTATCFFALLLSTFIAATALGQGLPKECQEAWETRSPQAQVDLFGRCLGNEGLRPEDKFATLKQRAIAYMHLGRHQRAIDDLNQAEKIKPGDSDLFYLRGFAYRALGQHDRSIEDSTKAINLDSNYAPAYSNRAFSYKAQGNINRAKSDARRAQDLDPSVKVPTF